MSGELTPGEVRQRLEDIHHHAELGAEIAARMSGELAAHIDWLTQQLADRDKEIDDLKRERDEEEADREQCAIAEEAKRLDVEDQLKDAERTIRELRDKIEYWEMDR